MAERSPAALVARHLDTVPLHRTIIRAAEAWLMSSIAFPRPLLDVGCGDGHFASMLFDEPVDAGIDLSPEAVAEAKARGIYRDVRVGSACDLPFPDASFASVLSNCVIEHIPDVQATLREISRVLRPDGLFVFTVPNPNFNRFLLGTRVFRRVGLPSVAEAYTRWFNAHSRHVHIDPPTVWRERLEAVGLRVERQQGYLSRAAMALFDLAHYYGVPSLVWKRLFGRWVLVPGKHRFWPPDVWLHRRVVRYCLEVPPDGGAYTLFVARKSVHVAGMGESSGGTRG